MTPIFRMLRSAISAPGHTAPLPRDTARRRNNRISLNGNESLQAVSIALFLVALPLWSIAQSERDDWEALRLRQNVVKVEVVRKSGGTENGFGFIVGAKDGSLYIVTAYHVVTSNDDVGDKNPQVSLTFYTDQGKSYPAEVLATHKPHPHDLAVLRVQTPPGFQMETHCLSDSDKEKRTTPVWSIGKLGNWHVQGIPGAVGEGPNSDQIITLDQMGVIPGSSGGPVVASTGIIGILLTDSAENTRALSIEYIRAAFVEWNYPWGLDKYDRENLDAEDARKLEARSPDLPRAVLNTSPPARPNTTSALQPCGIERWAVKTGTDDDVRNVDLEHPVGSSITHLISLAAPNPLPIAHRVAPVEHTVFTIQAILREYKLEKGDSDYHLILEDDSGNTMVAEIPSPGCVGAGSPFAPLIASARAGFDAKLAPTTSLRTANIPVRITGVGFFDFHHGQAGVAPNAIELHPVLNLVFDPESPGGADFTFSLSPTTVSVRQGETVSTTISMKTGNASSTTVSFVPTNLPIGVTSTVILSPAGNAVITFIASSGAKTGTFPVAVTGTAGQKVHTESLALNVLPLAASQLETSQWEYNFVIAETEQEVVERANMLGVQRWEVIGVVRSQNKGGYVVFFKRIRLEH